MYLQLIAYAGAAIFAVGVLFKVAKWSRMPFHLRWEIYPVPHDPQHKAGGSSFQESKWWSRPIEEDAFNQFKELFEEMLFIKRAFKQDKRFWLATYLFHGGTYLILLWAVLLAVWALFAPPFVPLAAQAVGWIGMGCMALGSVSLLAVRVGGGSRGYTTPAEFANLAFVVVMVLTGIYAWSADPAFNGAERFAASLLAPATAISLTFPMELSIAMVFIFLAYLPFTKMTHFVGKYFTYDRVLWNDAPLNDKEKTELDKYLGMPLSWSGSHIAKGKSWGENVKEVPGT